jgi:polysaccharide biosynthesis/export protein
MTNSPHRHVWIALASAALALSGCGMPRPVASLGEVQQASKEGRIQLVPVSASSIPSSPPATAAFPAEFLEFEPVNYDLIGAGDVLKVRIWESGAPTIFVANGGDLGEVVVDERGRLYLPYVGSLQVAGRTIGDVRAEVSRRLTTMVRNPQVDIRPGELRSKLVSVQGNAAKAGTYAIERGRTRIGELLGEIAPDLKNPEMLEVTVRRDGRTGNVRLADIHRNPALDIALKPGDSIVLNELVEHVTVLGAAGVQGQVRIAERDYSVTDILGQARGLNEDAADPRAVFLVRAEPGAATPTVYQFEMRRPETVALASRFIVRDKDAILISNAPFTQTRKALSAISQTLGTVRSAVTVTP